VADESDRLGDDAPVLPIHALELDVVASGSAHAAVLTTTWTWLPGVFCEQSVRDLADRLSSAFDALVVHADRPGAGGHTPSDFPLVSLTQQQVDDFEEQWRDPA
jgi:non-ribosomal peptide synthase protein (TIGR01720 family)